MPIYTPTEWGGGVKTPALLNIARAMLYQAQMSNTCWGEVILLSTSIVNVLPTKVLNWKTLYEIFYSKIPKYDNFHPFGCLCHYTNVHPYKDKFKARGLEAVFMGFLEGHKTYKLLDLTINNFVVSRDVVFQELVFPFSKEFTINSTEKTTPTEQPAQLETERRSSS